MSFSIPICFLVCSEYLNNFIGWMKKTLKAFIEWNQWQQLGAICGVLGVIAAMIFGILELTKPDPPISPPTIGSPPIIKPTAKPIPEPSVLPSSKPSEKATPPPSPTYYSPIGSTKPTDEIPYLTKQRLALESFFNSTGGTSWTKSTNWMEKDKSVCSWHGVTCDVNTGYVRELDLIGLGKSLNGTIPSQLGMLESVEYLRFHGHYLKGSSLPKELSKLTNLKTFQVSNCQLGGTIPPEYKSMTNLQVFDMRWNHIGSGIPNSIGDMASLQHLLLRYNNFRFEIPSSFGDLLKLKQLDLFAIVDLTGGVPTEVGRLTNLEKMFLAGTNIQGSIPLELKNLTYLQELSVPDSVIVPPEICNLTNESFGRLNYICQKNPLCLCCQKC